MLKKGFGNFIMNNDKEFLATEPIGKLLLRLAIPTLAAQMINMLYNIIDRIYIGHIPGSGALALTGVGVCMPLIMIISAFAALVGNGGAPRASILMGKKDLDSAENILGNCFTMQIIISVILTLIMFFGNRTFLMAFGASENTIEYAVSYMNIYSLGTIFVQLTLGMNAFITAQGFAKTGMYSVLIGAVINIILDPIFIFACHMGVRGAALATIISQACSCIWVLSFLFGTRSTLRIKKQNLTLKAPVILPCLALGLSLFVMQFAMLPLQGLGQGAQPIMSYNYGAKNTDRVKGTFFLLLKASLTYSIILWGLVMLFPQMFAGIFTSNPALVIFTKKALRVYMAVMFMFGIQISCQMAFNSLGKAISSIVVAVMRKFVLLIPLIYIMPHIFTTDQTMAVYMAEPVADFIAVTFTAILFSVQFKKALAAIRLS